MPLPRTTGRTGLHSKSHHQQYTDFIKSSKHRNGNHLVACADCHEPHGKTKFAHQMKLDSNSAESCTSCHKNKADLKQHMAVTAKCTAAADKITCSCCHNTKTMQTGAG
jgi:predicted CXXCH cytochrome family protein